MTADPATSQSPVGPVGQLDYTSLFNGLPERYIVFQANDPEFTIIGENDAHAAVAMTNRKLSIGKPVLEIFPDTSEKYKTTGVSDLIESFRKVVSSGKPDTMDILRYDLWDPSGNLVTKYWQVTHYPVRAHGKKSGPIQAIFQATRDLTEEITTGAQLSQTRQQLDQALSAGLIGTWQWDIKANVVIGDKYMANMFGVSQAEAAAGMKLDKFTDGIYEHDRERVKHEIEATMAGDGEYHSEYRTVSGDGSISWVIARGRVERDVAGEPVSFPGVLVDITDRKQAEQNISFLAKASSLLAASLNYHKTLQSVADLMVPTIADWCTVELLDSNNTLQSVVVSHQDATKKQWALKLRSEKPQKDRIDFRQSSGSLEVIKTGKPQLITSIDQALIDKSVKNLADRKLLEGLHLSSIIIVAITVNEQRCGALTLIASDSNRHYNQSDVEMAEELSNRIALAITNSKLYDDAQHELSERTRLEEALRKANEELEHRVEVRTNELEESNLSLQRSNQELQDFAYVASHDLQEPLRKIQAFGNILETEYRAEIGDGADYLARMRGAAARMSILIEDILSFSRVTTKGREFTTVDMHKVVLEVLEDLEVRIAETGAKINIGALPSLAADPVQIRQLFQNLLANALKFHRPNVPPVITVSAKTEPAARTSASSPAFCRVIISDNGLGFDEKYLDRIFAVFQRLHNREMYEGTGIGLAVCRKIVERHGGSITATSQLGKGSSFIILLPIRHKKGEKLL